MTDPGLLRFLELVTRELHAADARVELGGRDPEDPRLVWQNAPGGGRVVVVFDAPPEDRAGVEMRLETLIGPLFGAPQHALSSTPPSRTPPDMASFRLNDELGRLVESAGAAGAVVFDLASPVVWGASEPLPPDVNRVLADAIDRVRAGHVELHTGHATRFRLDEKDEKIECIARAFAGPYVIALVFEGLVSEPAALGALVRAMPAVERLVLALPPVNPPPGGAKVVRMPTRLR